MFAHHRGYWKTGLGVVLLLAMATTMSAQYDPQKTKVFKLEEAVELRSRTIRGARFARTRTCGPGRRGRRTNELFAAHRPSVAIESRD